jgi:hypothetical protein
VRAMIDRLMTMLDQPANEMILELEPGVVGA